MFWWILLGIFVLFTVVSIILYNVYDCDWWTGIALGGMFCFFGLLICLLIPVGNKYDINHFIQQKEYIESLDDSSHNIAIATKKVELNEWLYNAQYEYQNYKFFTFFDSSIMDLEEIK